MLGVDGAGGDQEQQQGPAEAAADLKSTDLMRTSPGDQPFPVGKRLGALDVLIRRVRGRPRLILELSFHDVVPADELDPPPPVLVARWERDVGSGGDWEMVKPSPYKYGSFGPRWLDSFFALVDGVEERLRSLGRRG